ncbi:hypothetical protein HCU01_22560 [Halomonas cupida]|uniref:Lipoprotein n=1 Tax=Halomonas cupida TaxID=44933 RepID=A0A1M7J454_9GAMM|nr:hypothetical protein [Halomonas cupida]GEN24307.1 hypothetical protein HCU01_22560 [Halomonas cupida]SHM47722.1 hypothetical protein SAMN05660971_03098 [Halomonas cupida]
MKNYFKELTLAVIVSGVFLSGCGSRLTPEDMMVNIKQQTIYGMSRETDPSTNITTISSSGETTDIYYNGYGEKTGERPSTLMDEPELKGVVKIHPDGRTEYFLVHSLNKESDIISSRYSSACRSDNETTFSADGTVVGPTPGEFHEIDSGWYGFVRINVDRDTFRTIAASDSLVVRSCLDYQDIVSEAEINALRKVFNESINQ